METESDFEPSFHENNSSVYLSIKAIADLEKCLSKLIETEADCVNYFTSVEDGQFVISDIVRFNITVNQILKDICMLQLLLQLKLDYINKLKCIYEESAGSFYVDSKNNLDYEPRHVSGAAIIKNMAEDEKNNLNKAANAINTSENTNCCLIGRAHGRISEQSDPFFNGTAIIQTYFYDNGNEDNFLCYSAMKCSRMINLTAYKSSLSSSYTATSDCKKIEVEGIGRISVKELFKLEAKDIGEFKLTVILDNKHAEKILFHMAIKATNNAEFDHSSGKIEAEYSNLQIKPKD